MPFGPFAYLSLSIFRPTLIAELAAQATMHICYTTHNGNVLEQYTVFVSAFSKYDCTQPPLRRNSRQSSRPENLNLVPSLSQAAYLKNCGPASHVRSSFTGEPRVIPQSCVDADVLYARHPPNQARNDVSSPPQTPGRWLSSSSASTRVLQPSHKSLTLQATFKKH